MKTDSEMELNRISRNFEVMKFGACLMVLFGHYYKNIAILWVPVTIGLIVFAFSSGLFTGLKYQGAVVFRSFWRSKYSRLGRPMLLANLFLLILFLVQDRPHIFSFHTLINVLGFNGVLNWFHIQNLSPFGNGMWFFTLLLGFYLVYPLINRMSTIGLGGFAFLSIITAWWLNGHHPYGHAVHITSSGFLLGLCAARFNWFGLPATVKVTFSLFSITGLVFFLVFRQSWLSFWVILMLGISFIFWAMTFNFPKIVYGTARFFSPCLLEIYIIHSYVFISMTGNKAVDFLCSVLVILFISTILNRLNRAVFSRLPRSIVS